MTMMIIIHNDGDNDDDRNGDNGVKDNDNHGNDADYEKYEDDQDGW